MPEGRCLHCHRDIGAGHEPTCVYGTPRLIEPNRFDEAAMPDPVPPEDLDRRLAALEASASANEININMVSNSVCKLQEMLDALEARLKALEERKP